MAATQQQVKTEAANTNDSGGALHTSGLATPLNADEMEQYALDVETRSERQLAAQFQPGNKLGVGNKRGRQKLTNAFVDALTLEFQDRGAQALKELKGKDLVQACIAILPKDVLVSLDANEQVAWVINAQPLSIPEWQAQHGLKTIEGETE